MYQISKKNFGYELTFSGTIPADEMKKWVSESQQALTSSPQSFGVLVDMRELTPLEAGAQAEMQKGQKLYKQNGMERSAVILSNAVITMQFKRIARQTGIYDFERYFDASSEPRWKEKALDWIENKVDPDK